MNLHILSAFAKLQKATIIFIISVHSSLHPSAWSKLVFFRKLSRKFKFHYNLTRIKVALNKDIYIYDHI